MSRQPQQPQQPQALSVKDQLALLVQHHLTGQQLLTNLGARFPNARPSVERIRTMPQAELQQYPDLWAAYVRGWEKCFASIPAPPPAFQQPAVRPPRAPLMGQQRFPTPRNQQNRFKPYIRNAAPPTTAPSESVSSIPGSTISDNSSSVSSAQKLTYKQKKKQLQRLAKELKDKTTSTSQQHRLEKKAEEPMTPPVPMPRSRPPSEAISHTMETTPMEIEGAMEGSETLNREIENFLNPPPNSTP